MVSISDSRLKSMTRKLSVLEKHTWELFRGEILRNCDFASLAYDDMMKYSQFSYGEKDKVDRLWLSVESFLIVVANVSKILWPSRPNKCPKCKYQPELSSEVSSRATELREILSVGNSSPLENRKFRNFFEHYDFELNDWIKEYNNNQIVFDSNVGPMESIVKSSSNPKLIIRHFDRSKSILYFRGKEYHVKSVLDALQELKTKTETIPL